VSNSSENVRVQRSPKLIFICQGHPLAALVAVSFRLCQVAAKLATAKIQKKSVRSISVIVKKVVLNKFPRKNRSKT
jgi:hypothetical protein